MQLLYEPRQGRKNIFAKRVVQDFCRPCRGSFVLLRIPPIAFAMGHILPPLRGCGALHPTPLTQALPARNLSVDHLIIVVRQTLRACIVGPRLLPCLPLEMMNLEVKNRGSTKQVRATLFSTADSSAVCRLPRRVAARESGDESPHSETGTCPNYRRRVGQGRTARARRIGFAPAHHLLLSTTPAIDSFPVVTRFAEACLDRQMAR